MAETAGVIMVAVDILMKVAIVYVVFEVYQIKKQQKIIKEMINNVKALNR